MWNEFVHYAEDENNCVWTMGTIKNDWKHKTPCYSLRNEIKVIIDNLVLVIMLNYQYLQPTALG